MSKLLKIGISFTKYDLRPSKVFRSGNTYSTSVIILVQLSYCFNQQHFKRPGIKKIERLTCFPCLHFCHYVTFFIMAKDTRVVAKQPQGAEKSVSPCQ